MKLYPLFLLMVAATVFSPGPGVILATSALAFTALKLAGAAYLLYLGVRLWRAPAFWFDDVLVVVLSPTSIPLCFFYARSY